MKLFFSGSNNYFGCGTRGLHPQAVELHDFSVLLV